MCLRAYYSPNRTARGLLALSLVAMLCPVYSAAQASSDGPPEHAPFKIFDNLYYVGINFVSAYLLTTSEGLILIDSTYDRDVGHIVSGIEAMGFDAADIKYILVTHWHADHFGGAEQLHKLTGATVGMIGEDWDSLAKKPNIPKDKVMRIKDGDSLTLGETTLGFYHLPGHTLGVLGLEFTVYDGGKPHKGFTFGGTGLNFRGLKQTQMYIESTKRVMAMEDIEVNITNHQGPGRIFARAERLAERGPGDPHPFVDPEGFQAYLKELMVNVEKKLQIELERAAR